MLTDERLHALYTRHAPGLRKHAQRWCLHARYSPDDLVQETFLRAWRHIDELPDDPDAARPWLYTTVRHIAIDHIRRLAVRPDERNYGTLTRIIEPASPTDDMRHVDDTHTVAALLAPLKPEWRAVLILRYLEGLTTIQVAVRLGIPVGTVKSRIHYGLDAIRRNRRAGVT